MRFRCALDGGLDAVVRHAAAQRARHRLADFRIGGLRVAVEEDLRGQDLPVLTEAALRDLLVDPGLLDRMEHAVLGQPFERGDLGALHGGRGPDTRSNRLAFDDHGACAALTESATEAWPSQAEIVAEDVEQRSRRIDIHGVRLPVHLQGDGAHGHALGRHIGRPLHR